MAKNTSRRNFLRTAPVAAAVGLTLTDRLLFAAQAGTSPGDEEAAAAAPFRFFPGKELEADAKALRAAPGNKNLITQSPALPDLIVMTTEVRHSASEFEWHAGHDHIFQIIDGSTLYEVGGTPSNGRNIRPGEWLAPASDGSKSIQMNKGDMLVIPRGTPHRRSTKDSVTFLLITTYGKMTT